MFKTIAKVLRYCAAMLVPSISFANQATGLGAVASNLMSPVYLFSDMIDTGCLVIGVGFLFASIIKYIEHRRSPLMVPISTVVFLVIAGIILVLLPFLPYLIGQGVPYSLIG